MANYRKIITDWYLSGSTNPNEIEKSIFTQWAQRIVDKYLDDLVTNNISSEDIEKFFFDKYTSYLVPSPYLQRSPFYLPDVTSFIEILKEVFVNKENIQICIYADRDADGITSSSMLLLFLRDQLGVSPENIRLYLPLESDKYGITEEVVERICKHDFNVFISLDCGSANKNEISMLQSKQPQAKFIIVDHHYIPEDEQDFPQVDAFINPKRLAINFPERDLCTASLMYKLIWAFVYSYTSEFNKAYQINNESYIQNGLLLNQTKAIALQMSTSELDQQWQKIVSLNSAISKLNKIIEGNFYTSVAEKLWYIQQFRLKNVYQKTQTYITLSAIGIIGDMMPLLNDNRGYVQESINIFNNNTKLLTKGLRALLVELSMLGKKITEQDIGFNISPALNAPGRLGNAQLASDLLITNDEIMASRLALEVKQTNEKRKIISKENIDYILTTSDFAPSANRKIEIIFSNKIHRGISGLVANNLANTWKKPVIIIVEDGEHARGSIRSYQNENSFSLLESCSDLFEQFGGHRQAAGFSIERENISKLKELAVQQADLLFSDENTTSEVGNITDFKEAIEIKEKEINTKLWQEIDKFRPYGILNPHPVICIPNLSKLQYKNMGKTSDHAKVFFQNIPDGRVEGVWFFHGGEINTLEGNKLLDIYVEPHYNEFQNNLKYQLKINKVVIK